MALPLDDRSGLVAGGQRRFDPLETGGVHLRRRDAQRQGFERRADLDQFLDGGGIEGCDTHAATRFVDHQAAGAQQLERLARRDVAGLELGGDMVLPQRRAGRQFAADDALAQHMGDPLGNRLSHD